MSRRLRVLHITPALFGHGGVFGGGERYAYELARHMAHEVRTTLVAFGDQSMRHKTEDGLNVHVLGPAWAVRGQKANPLHPGLLRHVLAADVIHCHQTNILASEFSALLGRMTGKKVFASDLGGGGWCFGPRLGTAKWFHSHLHISEYSRQLANGSSCRQQRVIFGGVDVERFSPSAGVAREKTVVFVGRLMPHKGVDDLIQGLPEGLTLELIGRPYHDTYYQRLKELAKRKNVLFRTDCNDGDVIHAYRRAMCVVLPSVYRDCYGNESKVPELLGQTPLEGMACGAPAIVTNVASLPEVVADGRTGFVVPANDPAAIRSKLKWLRDHPIDTEKMGAEGRSWVIERFTWPLVVQRCLLAYLGVPA